MYIPTVARRLQYSFGGLLNLAKPLTEVIELAKGALFMPPDKKGFILGRLKEDPSANYVLTADLSPIQEQHVNAAKAALSSFAEKNSIAPDSLRHFLEALTLFVSNKNFNPYQGEKFDQQGPFLVMRYPGLDDLQATTKWFSDVGGVIDRLVLPDVLDQGSIPGNALAKLALFHRGGHRTRSADDPFVLQAGRILDGAMARALKEDPDVYTQVWAQ